MRDRHPARRARGLLTALSCCALAGAGLTLAAGGAAHAAQARHATQPAAQPAATTIPRYDHVVLVMEENHAYNEIIGDTTDAPYINSLANTGVSFSQSFAIEHPSEPNYLDLFSGTNQGVTSDDCPTGPFTTPNEATELAAAGDTFAGYSEDLPATGSTVCTSGNYARKHVPWTDFSNVPGSESMPFSSFPTDYANLPTVSWVIPNLQDDMHDGTIAQGDTWLNNNLSGYATWATTHNSLLIVTWDEDDSSQANQIPTIFYGANLKAGTYSETINHYSVLRTIEDMYGLTYAGNSASATPITDVFSTGTSNTVTVTNPGNQTGTVGTAASLQIQASDSASGQTLTYSATGLPTGLSIDSSSGLISGTPTTAGTYNVTVTAKDGTGATGSQSFTWTITGGGGGGCTAAQLLGNPGFETGSAAPWTTTPNVISAGTASQPAHSGTYMAWLDGYGTAHTDTLAQTVTIPTGCTSATFSFYRWIDTQENTTTNTDDTLTVQVLNSSGTVLTTLATYSNLNADNTYDQFSFPLTNYIGQTITLKFTGTETDNDGGTTDFLIDDTALNVTPGGGGGDVVTVGSQPAQSWTTGQPVSLQMTATDSAANQTFRWTASGLPAGVSIAAGSGLISGTPTAAGSGTAQVTATDTTGASGSGNVAWTVSTPGGGGLTEVSSDPFTDTDAQHATEVEPDIMSHGSTIVAAFQVGRISSGGSSDLGWATSTDSGHTWQHGFLPGITVNEGGGQYQAESDASVAYDAKYGVWLISGLPIDSSGNVPGVEISRSTDGLTWQNPVSAFTGTGDSFDKNWTTCDNTPSSPYYGNCYTEADDTSAGNAEEMVTSTDGGQTWSAPAAPADNPSGLGGQPLVQPNGTVVVPFSTNGSSIRAFTSTDGGQSWNASVLVSDIQSHTAAGNLRDGGGLPSAQEDGAGTIYVVWQDCRFRSGCPSNDIVMSTSTDGTTWSAVSRIPIDATNSSADHMIPGIGIDPTTSGSSAKIGLYYYFYPDANCTASTCQLEAGYISSTNGGASWSAAQTVAGPMSLSQIASTSQGSMVGDYIACTVISGQANAVVAVGKSPSNGQAFDEAMYAVPGGLAVTGGSNAAQYAPTYRTGLRPSNAQPIIRH